MKQTVSPIITAHAFVNLLASIAAGGQSLQRWNQLWQRLHLLLDYPQSGVGYRNFIAAQSHRTQASERAMIRLGFQTPPYSSPHSIGLAAEFRVS